jgi:hypothetical protein
MRYRKAIIEYSLKYGVTKAAIRYNTNRQYIYRRRSRMMERFNPWQIGRIVLTVTQISTRRKKSSSSTIYGSEIPMQACSCSGRSKRKQVAVRQRAYNNFPLRPLNWHSPKHILFSFPDVQRIIGKPQAKELVRSSGKETLNELTQLKTSIRSSGRPQVLDTFSGGNSFLILFCARLRRVAGPQCGNKKHMNMKYLEAALEDTSIAGRLPLDQISANQFAKNSRHYPTLRTFPIYLSKNSAHRIFGVRRKSITTKLLV